MAAEYLGRLKCKNGALLSVIYADGKRDAYQLAFQADKKSPPRILSKWDNLEDATRRLVAVFEQLDLQAPPERGNVPVRWRFNYYDGEGELSVERLPDGRWGAFRFDFPDYCKGRFIDPNLPDCDTLSEAQGHLDAYAARRGYRAIAVYLEAEVNESGQET